MNIRKTVYLSAICLSLLVFLIPSLSFADSLDNWHVRNSVPGGYTLNAVAYGNGMFVAVGSGGTILSSPDGTTWTPRTSGTSAGLFGVTYGNGIFVIVGDAGTILTSSDGTSWTAISSGTAVSLRSVAHGNGIFVALSPLASVTSNDGIQWTVGAAVATIVRFGDGKFIALDYPGPGGFYESLDGLVWSFRPRVDGISGYFSDIVLHDGTYVVVGHVGGFEISPLPATEDIYTSTDGTNWTLTHHSSGSLNGTPFWINGVNRANGYYIAVSSAGRVFHSPDGYGWTLLQTPSTDWLYSVAYGSRTFVAVGSNGTIIQSDALIEPIGVPTLSEWGMILLVLFCGLTAIRFLQMSR